MKEDSLPALGNDGRDAGHAPRMPFWEMGTDGSGGSAIDLGWLEGFVQRSVSGDTAPMWMREFPGVLKAVWFNVIPVGWVGEWHPSPALQWVVALSGRWFIETQDGDRVEMGPGDIHWGGDLQGGDQPEERPAHLSGQLGDVPCVQLMIQFEGAARRAADDAP